MALLKLRTWSLACVNTHKSEREPESGAVYCGPPGNFEYTIHPFGTPVTAPSPVPTARLFLTPACVSPTSLQGVLEIFSLWQLTHFALNL